jgi:hypothetical protein
VVLETVDPGMADLEMVADRDPACLLDPEAEKLVQVCL